MIDKALSFLVDQVNQYIDLKTGESDLVLLTSVVDQEGNIQIPSDKIGCTLVNVEEERIGRSQSPYSPLPGGAVARRNPDIKLNLYVLFSANPTTDQNKVNNYGQGLMLLSYVVKCFQAKYSFDLTNSPGLDPEIKALVMDLYTLPIEQQNYLWGALGAKYMPSVIYRIRLVTIQEGVPLDGGPGIVSLSTNLH